MDANHSTPAHNGSRLRMALVGTEGSGKTVLTCVLAKRFSCPDHNGVFLEPGNPSTLKYVERVWATLTSREWPPSTSPGELFKLKWILHLPNGLKSELHLIDVAGQDIRKLFDDDEPARDQLLSPLDELHRLRRYCRRADIVLFLVNLRDFVGEGDPDRRAANEAAMKFAMDRVLADGSSRRAILVLTQTDQYADHLKQQGGWQNLTRQAMPYIYSAHLQSGRVPVLGVAAVMDTVVRDGPDGTPHRVPAPDFRSEGLDQLLNEVKQTYEALIKPPSPRGAGGMLLGGAIGGAIGWLFGGPMGAGIGAGIGGAIGGAIEGASGR